MPTIPVSLIKGDKTSVDTDYRDALPVNMYGVVRDILGEEGYMLCYPGLTQIASGAGIDRGGVYNDRLEQQYRVSGQYLTTMGINGVTYTLGSIPGTEQASMPYSFNTQGVVANGKFWLYDSTDGFRQVTNPFRPVVDGVWIDQYYFLTDGFELFHTSITSEDTIEPLAYQGSDFSPDVIRGLGVTQDNKVIVFNRHSIEYFTNVATNNFAFTRETRRAQKIGIVATHAKCEASGKFYITGGRKDDSIGVYVIGLGSSEKISSREVDKVLSAYTELDLSDMRMESRTEDNVTFVLVHLPNETLCFNETVAKKFGLEIAWSILKSDVFKDTTYRAINGVFDANRGKWVYGDKQDDKVGFLDNKVCTHYGEMVEWLLFSPLLNIKSMSIDQIEIETIPGHTTSRDASVSISLTYNGIIYSKEWFEMYGDPLDYDKNFIIRRLGNVDDNVGFKFRGTSTSRMAFTGLKVTYS